LFDVDPSPRIRLREPSKTSPEYFVQRAKAAPVAEPGSDALITWGRWTNGTTAPTAPGESPVAYSANQGMHFILGAMTPTAYLESQTSGTATFSLLGATKPTYGDGATAPGTFAGNVAVAWGGTSGPARIGVDLTVTMPDKTYQILSTGGTANPAASAITTGNNAKFFGDASVVGAPGRACVGGNCAAYIDGFLAGATAQRAGLVYQIRSDASIATSVSGAAVFSRNP
jgi:hypothetical protein